MDKTPKFSHLISDERWGETCLVDNLDQFMRDMEDSMFPAYAVSQHLAELREIAAERGEECEETAETIVDGWRNELRQALQDVETVTLPDGRDGWMVAGGAIYVEIANGLASYIGEWEKLSED